MNPSRGIQRCQVSKDFNDATNGWMYKEVVVSPGEVTGNKDYIRGNFVLVCGGGAEGRWRNYLRGYVPSFDVIKCTTTSLRGCCTSSPPPLYIYIYIYIYLSSLLFHGFFLALSSTFSPALCARCSWKGVGVTMPRGGPRPPPLPRRAAPPLRRGNDKQRNEILMKYPGRARPFFASRLTTDASGVEEKVAGEGGGEDHPVLPGGGERGTGWGRGEEKTADGSCVSHSVDKSKLMTR